MFHNFPCWLWGPKCIGERYLLRCFCPCWWITTPIQRPRTMLALPLVKTRWGIPQRDISNMPTSVASSGKLKHNKQSTKHSTKYSQKTLNCFYKNNLAKTHTKNKQTTKKSRLEGTSFILTWSATKTKNSKKGKKRLEYDNSHRLGLHKTPKKTITKKL